MSNPTRLLSNLVPHGTIPALVVLAATLRPGTALGHAGPDKAALAARSDAEATAYGIATATPPAVTATAACAGGGRGGDALRAAALAFDAAVLEIRQLRVQFDRAENLGRTIDVDDGGSVTIYPGVDDALTATAAAACAALPAKPSRAQLRRATAALTDAAATGQATVAAMRAAYAQLEVVCVAICSLDAGDVEDTQCMRHLGGRGNPYGRYAAD